MEKNKKRKSLKGVELGVTVDTKIGATVDHATMEMEETT